MTRVCAWAVVYASCFFFVSSAAWSQTDWTTPGYDAQRSSWVRVDPKISTTSVHEPDFKLLWKMKLDNEPQQLNALTPPALFDFYIGYRGFRSFAFLSGSSGRVFALDSDLARMDWEKKLGPPAPAGSADCPGGMTTNVTLPTSAAIPPLAPFVGRGRRNPAGSAVGKPKEGAVTLAVADGSGYRPPPQPVRKSTRLRPPTRVSYRGLRLVYALASDGMLYSMYVSNGQNRVPPIKFLPPNANAQGLIVVDDVVYVATTNGCGGVADGVWALDLESKKVTNWKSTSGGVAGLAGSAFGPEGMLYVATDGGSIVALEAKTLKQLGAYTLGGGGFTSSPVVIDYNDKDYLAATSEDERIHLLDGTKLGGSNGRTPVSKTPIYAIGSDFVPGALATWEDTDGTKWVLAPSGSAPGRGAAYPVTNGDVKNGAIVAWKIVDRNGSPSLEPGWISRDMVSPLPPIVVNGVIFAASSGAGGDASMSVEQRAKSSSRAVLYALDGATGKVLWDSGDAIASFVPKNGLSGGGRRSVFVRLRRNAPLLRIPDGTLATMQEISTSNNRAPGGSLGSGSLRSANLRSANLGSANRGSASPGSNPQAAIRLASHLKIVPRLLRSALLPALIALLATKAWAVLPDGPGKAETEKLCVQCHDLAKTVSVRQDRNGWGVTMTKMVALGAKFSTQDFNTILEYLTENFPAEELPPVNVNKARAIQLESRLSLKRSEAAKILRYRKEHGDFKSIEDLKNVPGVDFAKIEAKKDSLVF